MCKRESCTGSPCYVASGTFRNSYVDLRVNTASFPISVGRVYDSQRMVDGPTGIGWSSTLTPHLYWATYLFATPDTYQHEVDVIWPDGWTETFAVNGSTITPPLGHYDTLVHNTDGTFDLTPQHSRDTYHFSAAGALISVTDEFGNTLSYTYGTDGRVATIHDQVSGREVVLTWNANGRLAQVANGTRSIQYAYDIDGTLLTVTDPVGRVTAFEYTTGRFGPVLSSIKEVWGTSRRLLTRLTWNAAGQLGSYTEGDPAAGGETYTYTYDPSHLPAPQTIKTSSVGSKAFNYAQGGALITNDPARVYDPATGLLWQYRRLAGTTYYEYTGGGRLDRVANAEQQWTITYDPAYPEQIASFYPDDPSRWQRVDYEYYGAGNPAPGALKNVWVFRSDGTTRDLRASYVYDSHGRVTHESVVDLPAANYAYDAAGNLSSVVRGDGSSATYGYDSAGRMTSATDAQGNTTSFTYDALDRFLSIELPRPSSTSTLDYKMFFSYDHYDAGSGLVFTWITDPNGRVTKQGYDVSGNLVQAYDALGAVTTFSYLHGLLDHATDANGNVTSYTYDSERRLASTTYQNGNVESYGYNEDGSIASVRDRRGILTRYTYDAAGRLIGRNAYQPDTTFLAGVGIGYSGQKMASVSVSPGDILTFTYDSSFRVATETHQNRERLTYTYKPAPSELVAGFTADPVSGSGTSQHVDYFYDDYGRINTIRWSLVPGGDFTIAYAPNGQYGTVALPNGQTRTYTYDNQGRLTRLANYHPSTGNIATFDYGYDHDWSSGMDTVLGQRTSMTVSTDAATPNQPVGTTTYRYDANYRLVRSDYPGGNWDKWSYDAVGNITQRQTPNTTLPNTYYQNALNKNTQQLKSWFFSPDYSYDQNGNQTKVGTSAVYVWNALNQLATSSANATYPSSYTYDAYARRVTATTNNFTTSYWYEGFDTISARTSLGTTDYLFLPGIDEPVAMSTAGTVSYFGVDGLGSVISRTSSVGQVLEGARYSPWGEATGSITGEFGFTGRERSDLGLYFRARIYQPAIGRFISEDPADVEDVGGSYTYGTNDPVSFVDPLGLSATTHHPGCPDPCDELRRAIQEIVKDMSRRSRDIQRNNYQVNPLPLYGPRDSVESHQDVYRGLKRGLRRRLKEWNDNHCGEPPDGAREWARSIDPKPLPGPARKSYPSPGAPRPGFSPRNFPMPPPWVLPVVGVGIAATCFFCPACCLVLIPL